MNEKLEKFLLYGIENKKKRNIRNGCSVLMLSTIESRYHIGIYSSFVGLIFDYVINFYTYYYIFN